MTLYSMGLRLSEGLNLTIHDIDKSTMLVHVRDGKGGKNRMVPMLEHTLLALQGELQQTLVEQKGTDVLAKLFAQDYLYQTSHQDIENTNANQLVNFTGNHDMGHFAYTLKESDYNYGESEQIQRNLLAHAPLYFSRGVPIIYYGDEQGFVGDGGDQASRQDMMPSQVVSYNDDDLLASNHTTADDNFDTSHLFYQNFAQYAELYQQYPALRFGKQSTVYA
ncbi:MAG: glycosidase [Cognaticolwellia sp.]|jgi:glycosidase